MKALVSHFTSAFFFQQQYPISGLMERSLRLSGSSGNNDPDRDWNFMEILKGSTSRSLKEEEKRFLLVFQERLRYPILSPRSVCVTNLERLIIQFCRNYTSFWLPCCFSIRSNFCVSKVCWSYHPWYYIYTILLLVTSMFYCKWSWRRYMFHRVKNISFLKIKHSTKDLVLLQPT